MRSTSSTVIPKFWSFRNESFFTVFYGIITSAVIGDVTLDNDLSTIHSRSNKFGREQRNHFLGSGLRGSQLWKLARHLTRGKLKLMAALLMQAYSNGSLLKCSLSVLRITSPRPVILSYNSIVLLSTELVFGLVLCRGKMFSVPVLCIALSSW